MVTSALHARLKAAETQSLVFWWNGVDCEKSSARIPFQKPVL
jgi:hypothetical protein